MKLWDIVLEWLRDNLLLFRDADRYRSVVAARTTALLILATAAVALWQLAIGKITFDMGFVLGIFSIFISWLFFWSAERSSRSQMEQLQSFLRDFKSDSTRGMDMLKKKLDDMETVFSHNRRPPPPPESPTNGMREQDVYASAVAEMMKDGPKQIIIAMLESGRSISPDLYIMDYNYEHNDKSNHNATMVQALARDLRDVGMVMFDQKTGSVTLSERGQYFAKWLIEHGQKATFFECNALGIKWGEPSPRHKHFIEQIRRREKKEG